MKMSELLSNKPLGAVNRESGRGSRVAVQRVHERSGLIALLHVL